MGLDKSTMLLLAGGGAVIFYFISRPTTTYPPSGVYPGYPGTYPPGQYPPGYRPPAPSWSTIIAGAAPAFGGIISSMMENWFRREPTIPQIDGAPVPAATYDWAPQGPSGSYRYTPQPSLYQPVAYFTPPSGPMQATLVSYNPSRYSQYTSMDDPRSIAADQQAQATMASLGTDWMGRVVLDGVAYSKEQAYNQLYIRYLNQVGI